jgi:hypothetical protein
MLRYIYPPLDPNPFSVEVDGVLVDPRGVVVSKQFGQSKCHSLIVVRISKTVLLHELAKADIALEPQAIAAYIRDDLWRDIPTGVKDYLLMVRQMAENLEKPPGWRWIRRNPNTDASWEWCSLEEVQESTKMIEFIGTAKPLANPRNADCD